METTFKKEGNQYRFEFQGYEGYVNHISNDHYELDWDSHIVNFLNYEDQIIAEFKLFLIEEKGVVIPKDNLETLLYVLKFASNVIEDGHLSDVKNEDNWVLGLSLEEEIEKIQDLLKK